MLSSQRLVPGVTARTRAEVAERRSLSFVRYVNPGQGIGINHVQKPGSSHAAGGVQIIELTCQLEPASVQRPVRRNRIQCLKRRLAQVGSEGCVADGLLQYREREAVWLWQNYGSSRRC